MQTILITGANGFVGKALVRALKNRDGISLRGLGRQQPTPKGASDFASFYQADLVSDQSRNMVAEALAGCQSVVHLASRVHQMNERGKNTLELYRATNVEATRSLALEAAKAGVKTFLFMSSIKVNGEKTSGQPFSELDTPAPQDPYGLSKWEAEQALQEIGKSYPSMRIIILRPPLVFGAGVKANFASLVRLVRSVPLLPLGAINNRRSLINVENLVNAIETALFSERAKGTYLVADEPSQSTASLATAIAAVWQVKAVLIPVPPFLLKAFAALLGKQSQASRLIEDLEVDSKKFRSDCRWSQPLSLDEALKRMRDS